MKIFRKFLAPPQLADSYVRVESSYDSIELKIADCHRAIYLTFSYNKLKHVKASLKKLKILEDALSVTREELESKLK